MIEAVTYSQRAYRQMTYEIERSRELETGGVLLGWLYGEELRIVEAIDGGFRAESTKYSFAYDEQYVLHLMERLMSLYTPPLQLVGLWHKHNSFHERPFSHADMDLHKQMYEIAGGQAVSCLFQKRADTSYEMGTYRLERDGDYFEIPSVIMGNDPVGH